MKDAYFNCEGRELRSNSHPAVEFLNTLFPTARVSSGFRRQSSNYSEAELQHFSRPSCLRASAVPSVPAIFPRSILRALMATYRLAVIIQSPSENDDCTLLLRQTPPPNLPEAEYSNYIDSDLWDLPSAPLNLLPQGHISSLLIDQADKSASRIDLGAFDIGSAADQVLSHIGVERSVVEEWVFWKYVEEAEFGPEPLVHSVFIYGKLKSDEISLQGAIKWMPTQHGLELLLEVTAGEDRIGHLMSTGLLADLVDLRKWKVPQTLKFQEYPPGVTLVPLRSRTQRPFLTTNLVVIAANNGSEGCEVSSFSAYGDGLMIDPGCHSGCHTELKDIVTALPRKLVVFVTHHHIDHIDGLSVVQKCNPDAILLAHENTMHRIGKGNWSRGYIPISGGEVICIGNQSLKVIAAMGHTDGHMALLHVSTNSLVVGDHCVGQGSAILDVTSGGNMKDYFQTTYNFLDLAPHILIPMHGRVNLWPKYMLCRYLKNRRDRESSILKIIESGGETLFDIVAKVYANVDIRLWLPASSNVRLHLDFLAYQDKLPKEFSVEKFKKSCGLDFQSKWLWMYLTSRVAQKAHKSTGKLLAAAAVAGFAAFCAYRWKSYS